MAGQQAYRTADFVNSIGVNTHVGQGIDTPSDVISEMQYLGITNIRDAGPSAEDSNLLGDYNTLAQAGLKIDMGPGSSNPDGSDLTTAGLQDYISGIAAFAQQNPGALASIEGFNEINNWPVNYNGQQQGETIWADDGGNGSYAPAAQAMHDLYNAVKTNPVLENIPVYDLTSGNSGLDSQALGLDQISGYADYANIHPYANGSEPELDAINAEMQVEYPNLPANTPKVITEFGYPSDGSPGSVSRADQETLTLKGWLDAYRLGFSKTYAYVMLDESNWPGFGLFQADQTTPNPLAVGLHNLTSILNDTGSTATSFTTGTLNYTLSGMPSQAQSMLLQKSSGAFDLALWNDGTSSCPVSVNLGGTYANVSVYDVVTGTTAIQTLHNVNSVSLDLASDPMIVEVSGNVTTASGSVSSSASVLDLSLSEDAWKGDAQFTVSVDGKQVGGIMTAHALHSSGDGEHVQLTGNWGSGAHTVAVTFLNDAWGGTASTDRNLYVNSIALDGIQYANTSAALYTNGTKTFTVGGSAAQ
ncbi:MAG: hypothetical protein JO122_14750, partial [Acetobacteraceae bacterium]|nr:hypothetical protein [Acetobacteraceae bacterium]